ncbi:4Fe-4S binding protein [Desulfurococcaceae archaeon MEX13E-LK6-19]|nr:4Fe-4S binding protein [Desulfurococcaceae archaeon MEX13E-LK6-19]
MSGSKPEPRGWRDLPLSALPYKLSLEYKTGDWRALRPVIDQSKCVKCLMCWLFCPEMAILWDGKQVSVNLDYCKGCGICAHECPVKAIKMIPEPTE